MPVLALPLEATLLGLGCLSLENLAALLRELFQLVFILVFHKTELCLV